MNYSMGNWPNFHQIVELQSPFTWLNSKLNQVVYLLYLFPLYYLLPLLLVWMSNWCRSIWQLADPGSDTDNVIVSGHHPWLLVTNSDNERHHQHCWPRHLRLFDNYLHRQIFGIVWSHLFWLESVSSSAVDGWVLLCCGQISRHSHPGYWPIRGQCWLATDQSEAGTGDHIYSCCGHQWYQEHVMSGLTPPTWSRG